MGRVRVMLVTGEREATEMLSRWPSPERSAVKLRFPTLSRQCSVDHLSAEAENYKDEIRTVSQSCHSARRGGIPGLGGRLCTPGNGLGRTFGSRSGEKKEHHCCWLALHTSTLYVQDQHTLLISASLDRQ